MTGRSNGSPVRPFFDGPAGAGPAPYRLVADFGDPPAARRAYESLVKQGCPVCTWPDLAPEVMAEKQVHDTAMTLRRNLLLLPVHADLDIENFVTEMGFR